MCKLRGLLFAVCLFGAFVVAGTTFGDGVIFSDGGGTGKWSDGGNWLGGVVPGVGDRVYVHVGQHAVIDYAAGDIDVLYLSYYSGGGRLDIVEGGSVTVNGGGDWSYLGVGDFEAVLKVSGDGAITFNGNPVLFSHSGSGKAVIDISDGGKLVVNDRIELRNGTSRTYIKGGVLRADDITFGTGDNVIEISGDGKLQVRQSNYFPASASGDISAGRIVCVDKAVMSSVNIGGVNYTQIEAKETLAHGADPVDGVRDVSTSTLLSWQKPVGLGECSYDVYLGASAFLRGADSIGQGVGEVSLDVSDLLSEGRSYYWRVDVHAEAKFYKGKVWSFDTIGKVIDRVPEDGAVGVPVGSELSWDGDSVGESFNVYIGESEGVVVEASEERPLWGDVDGDGFVNIFDIAGMARYWLLEVVGVGAEADMTGDGVVNVFDFAKIAGGWLERLAFGLGIESEGYDSAGLDYGRRYYWRVDESNDGFGGSPWAGEVLSFRTASEPETYYVAVGGSDGNGGTMTKPFASIGKAGAVMEAGDKCYVRGGRYHEAVEVSGLSGGEGREICFEAYPGESVVLDGTEAISDLQTSGWVQHSGSIYKTTLSKDVWQLFDGDELMIAARWPNARYDDGSVWEQDATWGHQAGGSTWGTMISRTDGGRPDLGATGKDFTGAIAVLNLGNFMTHSRFVNSHSAGSNTFTYDADYMEGSGLEGMLGGEHFWTGGYLNGGRYFLECDLDCLDIAKEWYYDRGSKTLYFYAADGQVPSGDIRGKTIEYSFDFDGASYVRVSGFDFFGSTFRFRDSVHCAVEDCDFEYYSFNKRMLGVEDKWHGMYSTLSTVMAGPAVGEESGNVISDCTFAYTDGGALAVIGGGDLIDNCLFHDIDWTGVGFITIHAWESPETTMRRLTVYRTGASECLQTGARNVVELCDLGEGLGIMQDDGAAIQVSSGWQYGAVVRHCWVHDNEKFAVRADYNGVPGQTFPVGFGFGATFDHNVCWGQIDISWQPPIWVGGDFHKVCNNLSYDNLSSDITLWAADGANTNSVVRNNAAGQITGERWGKIAVASVLSNNFVGDVWSQVRDKENRDFRPKVGSGLVDAGYVMAGITDGYVGAGPDIGAYEYGDENYWIPGYRGEKASGSIPADNAQSVSEGADLMWLGGRGGISYDVYFGTVYGDVAGGDRDSVVFRGNQGNNIFEPGYLTAGVAYFWRIDTVVEVGVVKGDVWRFKAGAVDYDPSLDRVFTGSASGAWDDPDNWDPYGVPGAGSWAYINNGRTVTLESDAGEVFIFTLGYNGDGDATLNITDGGSIRTKAGSDWVMIGGMATGVATLNMTGRSSYTCEGHLIFNHHSPDLTTINIGPEAEIICNESLWLWNGDSVTNLEGVLRIDGGFQRGTGSHLFAINNGGRLLVNNANYSAADAQADIAAQRIGGSDLTVSTVQVEGVSYTQVEGQAFVGQADSGWTEMFVWTSGWESDSAWFGADGAYSIPLSRYDARGRAGETKTLWTFADSLTGSTASDRPSHIPYNTLAVMEGGDPATATMRYIYGTNGNGVIAGGNAGTVFVADTPRSPAYDGSWPRLWLSDGIRLGEQVYIFARLIGRSSAPWGYDRIGTVLITVPFVNGELDLVNHSKVDSHLFLAATAERHSVQFGSCILDNTVEAGAPHPDGYIYVYGASWYPGDGHFKLFAARVLPDDFEGADRWEYRTATGWSDDINDSVPIAGGVETENAVAPLDEGKYLLVNEQRRYLYCTVGANPWGPFDINTRKCFYSIPEFDQGDEMDAYNGKAHPHLSEDGEILIGYNVNAFPAHPHIFERNVYRPRFAMVRIDDIVE